MMIRIARCARERRQYYDKLKGSANHAQPTRRYVSRFPPDNVGHLSHPCCNFTMHPVAVRRGGRGVAWLPPHPAACSTVIFHAFAAGARSQREDILSRDARKHAGTSIPILFVLLPRCQFSSMLVFSFHSFSFVLEHSSRKLRAGRAVARVVPNVFLRRQGGRDGA